MTRAKQPTLRAVWLGQSLKEIREAAKLTVRQVGDHVGKDGSSISRIECGEQPISTDVLEGFMDFCSVTDSHRRADLMIVRNDVAQGGWWDGYRRDVAATLMDRAWLESKALTIQSFDITYLPGLLQLPAYAESLMRSGQPDVSALELDRWIDMRMQRQHVITKHRPVLLNSVIDEQLLRRVVGSTDTMREQLDYLAEVSERSNIDIRILPADICTGVPGSFELFTLVDPYPQVGYVATAAGDLCVEDEALTDLSREYARIERSCLTSGDSRQLIIAERDKL